MKEHLQASLEPEVLSYTLLDFFSTAMLVQKVATTGPNSYTPHTWRNYLLYISTSVYWIKNGDSIDLFYFCMQYEPCVLMKYENLILWKKGTW
jgi:hypothetical protein